MKKIVLFILILTGVLLLIFAADEGKRPLVLKGTDLEQSAGTSDWTGLIGIDESAAFYGLFANTDDYVLNRGTYTIRPSYSATAGKNLLEVWDNGTRIAQWNLETTNGVDTTGDYTFTLNKDSQDLHIRIYYMGEGSLVLKTLELAASGRFYQDVWLLAALAVLLSFAGAWLYRYGSRKQISAAEKMDFCFLVFLCLFVSAPLFVQSFPYMDDICYHLLRIEGIKDGLLDGQFPVMIFPEALCGNGYLNVMYPNLFLYIPALLRLTGVSLALACKVLMFLANAATVIITWRCLRSMVSGRYAPLLGTALYMLMPYRYTNFYARGAIGEALALTFLPLIVAGFYHVLFGDRKKWFYLVLGFTGVIQSHVLSTAFMAGIFGIGCVVFIRDLLRDRRILELVKAAVLTLLLNLWFLVPFVYTYFKENLYTKSLEWSGYTEYSINASYLTETVSAGDYRFLSLGLPILLLAAASICILVCEHRKTQTERFQRYLFAAACILAFMVTGYFGSMTIREKLPFTEGIFRMIQFPWRLLAPAGILFIFSGVIWLAGSPVFRPYRKILFIFLIGVNLLTGITRPMNQNNFAYKNYDDTTTVGHEDKLIGIPKTDATVIYPYEWRIDALTDDKLTADLQLSDGGRTQVLSFEKRGTTAKLEYQTTDSGAWADFPVQNYIGVRAMDETGKEVETAYGNNFRVRTLLTADGNTHNITIYYQRPLCFRIAELLSLLTLVALAVQMLRDRRIIFAKNPAGGRHTE